MLLLSRIPITPAVLAAMEDEEEANLPQILYRCGHCTSLYPNGEEARECCRVSRAIPPPLHVTKQEMFDQDDSPDYVPNKVELWCERDTKNLIRLIKNNYHRFKNKEKKGKVWRSITEELRKEMTGVTVAQVENKWKNVKQRFRKYESQQFHATGRARKPAFYETLKTFVEVQPTEHVVECGVDSLLGLDKDTSQENFFTTLVKQSLEEVNQAKEQPATRQVNQSEEQEEDESEGSPSQPRKRRRRENDTQEAEQTLHLILEESRRHNKAAELHNAQLRLLFAKIAASMEMKNKILKDVVDKEQGFDA